MHWKQIARSGVMGLIFVDLSIRYSSIFFIKKYTSEIASESPFAVTTLKNIFKDVRYYILCLKFCSLSLLFFTCLFSVFYQISTLISRLAYIYITS